MYPRNKLLLLICCLLIGSPFATSATSLRVTGNPNIVATASATSSGATSNNDRHQQHLRSLAKARPEKRALYYTDTYNGDSYDYTYNGGTTTFTDGNGQTTTFTTNSDGSTTVETNYSSGPALVGWIIMTIIIIVSIVICSCACCKCCVWYPYMCCATEAEKNAIRQNHGRPIGSTSVATVPAYPTSNSATQPRPSTTSSSPTTMAILQEPEAAPNAGGEKEVNVPADAEIVVAYAVSVHDTGKKYEEVHC